MTAPSQHTGWSDEAVEAAAKALVTAKGTNPLTLFQFNVFTGDEPFDHEDDQGRRFIYSWRKQVENAKAALTAASSIAPATGFEVKHIDVAHDGFSGDVIGSYVTREGKRGFVVQQDGTRVVHVYGEKFAGISPSVAKESGEVDPSVAFARWINQGPKLALAADCYVGITVTALPTAPEAKP